MSPAALSVGLHGLCPRCGAATLFAGLLAVRPVCPRCGLDRAAFNVGDGPAAFVTAVAGALVVAAAVWLELAVEPPAWVHLLLWPPLTLILVFGGLRVAKGWLLAREYGQAAREGRRL